MAGTWWTDQHYGTFTLALTVVLIGVTLAYVIITAKLLGNAQAERVERRREREEQQAQLIGAYLGLGPQNRDLTYPLVVTIVNASALPIRSVIATIVARDTGEERGLFPIIVVLRPGEEERTLDIPAAFTEDSILHLQFDDDAGRRWKKYESLDHPLRRIERPDPR